MIVGTGAAAGIATVTGAAVSKLMEISDEIANSNFGTIQVLGSIFGVAGAGLAGLPITRALFCTV